MAVCFTNFVMYRFNSFSSRNLVIDDNVVFDAQEAFYFVPTVSGFLVDVFADDEQRLFHFVRDNRRD